MKVASVALYPAGQKNKPRYYTNLREGDIEIDELVDLCTARAGMRPRGGTCSSVWRSWGRGGAGGRPAKGPAQSLDESITLDERRLVALNLSEFKSAAEKDEL